MAEVQIDARLVVIVEIRHQLAVEEELRREVIQSIRVNREVVSRMQPDNIQIQLAEEFVLQRTTRVPADLVELIQMDSSRLQIVTICA